MRTARSQTLGENLLDFLFMAQTFQRQEPLQNPERFTLECFRKVANGLRSKGPCAQEHNTVYEYSDP